MIRVTRRLNEPIDKTLRRFLRRCEKEGLAQDMKRIEYFEPPSVLKRRATVQHEREMEKLKAQKAQQKNESH